MEDPKRPTSSRGASPPVGCSRRGPRRTSPGALPSPDDRGTSSAALRPRGLAYWTEALPPLVDWPDAPCVYLRTSEAYDRSLRAARARGWPTDSLELGHFPGLVDADRTAQALLGLLAPVVPGLTTG